MEVCQQDADLQPTPKAGLPGVRAFRAALGWTQRDGDFETQEPFRHSP